MKLNVTLHHACLTECTFSRPTTLTSRPHDFLSTLKSHLQFKDYFRVSEERNTQMSKSRGGDFKELEMSKILKM